MGTPQGSALSNPDGRLIVRLRIRYAEPCEGPSTNTPLSPMGLTGQQLKSLLITLQAERCWSRFELSGNREDLESAISFQQITLDLCPRGDSDRAQISHRLAFFIFTRFERWGNKEDLEKSIILDQDGLNLRPEGHPDRPSSLGCLANSLTTRFCHGRRVRDIEDAIALHRAALELRTTGHPDRSLSMGNLAWSLSERFQHGGKMADLEEAIALHRAVLDLHPEGHPIRAWSLPRLALCLSMRFKHVGRMQDLQEAITIKRDILCLLPEGNAERPLAMGNLASSLWGLFVYSGRMNDLQEAIALNRAVVALLPESHPGYITFLVNLAGILSTRFKHRGGMQDLEEAIALDRAALNLLPKGHPDRAMAIGNLAGALTERFDYGRRMQDLEEAVTLHRIALELFSETPLEKYLALGNLASSLSRRFDHEGAVQDLEESISLQRIALDLQPGSQPDRHISLRNLATSLSTRFQHGGRMQDIEEAIALNRAAVDLLTDDHPSRSYCLHGLANSLSIYFEYSGRSKDIEEAIALQRAALELQPEGHPERSSSFDNLARSLYTRFVAEERIEDLEECCQSLRHATAHKFSSFRCRFASARIWATLARQHNHPSALEAYSAATSLLQHALTIRPNLSLQHEFLSSDEHLRTFALDAASYAVAIEFLEQGRALLWSQMRGLRTPIHRLSETDKALAERFEDCNRRLEALITSSESYAKGLKMTTFENNAHQEQSSFEEKLSRMRQLSEEQEKIINDIRRIRGFEDFLKASPFTILQQAASEGPVVVLNYSKYRCDALIVLSRDTDPCVCVPLDKDFYDDTIKVHDEFIRVRRGGVGSKAYDEIFRQVMRTLWDRVVALVADKLRELGFPLGSRIWWCPTSLLSAFPFHAAGPYEGAGGRMRYFLDDYISSYTPTLASLISARSGIQSGGEKMLLVGDTRLPSAKKERDAIIRIRRFKQVIGDRATPQAVLKKLRSAHWVHFVCHGQLDDEPFKSALNLPGGRLTLLDIARASLPNAEFAFLSACHTAEQGPKFALDEALHLAAAMQFCGFRSVVGTMWKLLDRDGPYLAGNVYAYMMRDLERGEIRFKRAAAAVRATALRLRERGDEEPNGNRVDMMAERWVNLVHIGA